MTSYRTITYPGPLFYDALLERLNEATELIEIATFLLRTGEEGGAAKWRSGETVRG